MKRSNFFSENDDDPSCWRAYVSSALTIIDSEKRDRIIKLNLLIKEWLEEHTNTFAYLPQEYSDPSRAATMKPEEIYVLDRWRIAESDFVIMNLDSPSFGVGQEAEIACSMGIPVIAFHYAGYSVSRMIKGVPAIYSGEEGTKPSEGVIAYEDTQSYSDLKGELIAKIMKLQKHVKRLPEAMQSIDSFSARLKKALQKSRKTEAQIAKEAGFTEAFLRSLMSDYKSIESIFEPYELIKMCKLRNIPHDRYINPGLWVLRKLSETLDIRISALIGEEQLDRIWHEPLYELSKRGVTLQDFVDVADEADYLIMYRKAARTADKGESSQEVAARILKLVEARRNEREK